MKRILSLAISLFAVFALTSAVLADEESSGSSKSSYSTFGIDLGLGLSMGIFDSESPFFMAVSSDSATRQDLAALAMIYSFRINIFIDFRFNIISILGLGVETGLNWLSYEYKANDTYYTDTTYWFDIPFRGFVRVGLPSIYFQASGGYYLGITDIWRYNSARVLERGPELGGRLAIFGFYIEGYYIFANINPHLRVGLGYTVKVF